MGPPFSARTGCSLAMKLAFLHRPLAYRKLTQRATMDVHGHKQVDGSQIVAIVPVAAVRLASVAASCSYSPLSRCSPPRNRTTKLFSGVPR